MQSDEQEGPPYLCYRCNQKMLPDYPAPGHDHCAHCNLTVQRIGRPNKSEYEALFDLEASEKQAMSKKGGNSKGRTRSKPKKPGVRWYEWDREEPQRPGA